MTGATIANRPFYVSLFCTSLVLTLSCADTQLKQNPRACAAIAADSLWAAGETFAEDTDSIHAVLSRRNAHPRGDVLYAYEADLDCDQALDIVVQSADSGRLYLTFYRSSRDSVEALLESESEVAGREVVVALGASHAMNLRTIVIVGSDEGGLVPRIFVWRELHYAELALPDYYLMRMEEEWSPLCRRVNTPVLLADERVILSRETISLSAKMGHGIECDLPRDTVVIASVAQRFGGLEPR